MAAIAVGFHLQQDRALAAARMLDSAAARFADSDDIHAVHFLARNVEADAALVQMRFRR